MKIGDLVRLTKKEQQYCAHDHPERIEPAASAIGLVLNTGAHYDRDDGYHCFVDVLWQNHPVLDGPAFHMVSELELVRAAE